MLFLDARRTRRHTKYDIQRANADISMEKRCGTTSNEVEHHTSECHKAFCCLAVVSWMRKFFFCSIAWMHARRDACASDRIVVFSQNEKCVMCVRCAQLSNGRHFMISAQYTVRVIRHVEPCYYVINAAIVAFRLISHCSRYEPVFAQ